MSDINLIEVLRQTTPVTQFVLVILLIFSVWSWAIILSKALLLRKINKESETFWKIFRKGQSLSEIGTATPRTPVRAAGGTKKPLRDEEAAASMVSSLIFQKAGPLGCAFCRSWHLPPERDTLRRGCRGFVGPVPLPLVMRSIVSASLSRPEEGCQMKSGQW